MKCSQRTRLLLFAVAPVLLGGCAATVVPPANPVNPRPAFILDHGRHTTLVVVDSSGRPVRYAFGEVGDATHDDDDGFGFFRGLGALLVPDAGMLGRRVLPGPATGENVLAAVGVPVENLHCIAVSGERANRLQRVLNLVFEENLATATYNPDWNLEFVEDPDDYWFGDDPNQAVENWLIELGCKVSGVTTFGEWEIERPPDGMPMVCLEGSRKSKVEGRK